MRIHLSRALTIAALVAGALLVPATASAAPPANDDFANATIIAPSSLPFSDAVNIVDAGNESGENSYCGVSNTVWYSFTPSSDGVIRADSSGSDFFGPVLNVYRQDGAGIGGLSFIGCSQYYNPTISFSVQAGQTYYIQGGSSFWGSGSLHFTLAVVPPPPNDDFADAAPIGSLPFSDAVDTTAASVESGEPTPSCGYGQSAGTVWYAFTPSESGSYSASVLYSGFWAQVAVYTGNDLGSLSSIGCRTFGQPLTFHADAGTTYYFQVGGLSGARGPLTFNLGVAPAPTAGFSFYPGDPSTFDTVQFYDQSYDPAQAGFSSEVWDFGDGSGATNPGCCPTHRYSADGTYKVKLTVTTTDGRTASTSRDVIVKTHDVSIARVAVPQTAAVGQTRMITVGLTNSRYPETVQVQLLKSVAGGGWQQVGTLTQYVPVRPAGRTTNFDFNYTFASEDAQLGKVSFQAVATIQGAHDAIPADNTFISLPTKVIG